MSAWRNAARPGATSEAARSIALIVGAAQRFDCRIDTLTTALAVLASRGATPLDAKQWTARQGNDATARGEAVADLLI